MKKFTLVAMMALAAGVASAQYTVDPGTAAVLEKGKVSEVQYLALDEASIKAYEAQGATCTLIGPNGDNNNLWVWDNTFAAGDATYPGVDMHFDGYASFVVGTVGWSGAGYNTVAPGISTANWTDETHFHIAYMSPGTVCPSIALIIGDGDLEGSSPAKVSLGNVFVDGGVAFPQVGPIAKDDWQAVDITLGDLKKLFPSFNYVKNPNWVGNIMSFLAGGTTGQTLAFDAVYFYNYEGAGVADIELDNNAPVEYFNLQGVRMQGELAPGLYIVRQGNTVNKVAVK